MKFKTRPAQPPTPFRQAARPAAVPTIISADMVVEGHLKSAGEVQVEGMVIGQIEAGQLVITQSGTVTGDITVEQARICGTLNGKVTGGSVTLTATARVTGDVHHDLLAIEPGALLEGHSRRRAGSATLTALPEPAQGVA